MEPRRVLNGLAAIGAVLGMGAIFLARPSAAALGMPSDRRSTWTLRLFGVREVVLGLGLARAACSREPGQARLMADLVAAAQAGDMFVSGALLVRGDISRRAMAVVWLGAVPTLLATRVARRAGNLL
jgi:hypothetical protein